MLRRSSLSLGISLAQLFLLSVVFSAGTFVGCKKSSEPASAPRSAIEQLVADESFILDLTPRLRALGDGIRDLQLPSPAARELFAAQVEINDLLTAPAAESTTITAIGAADRDWPTGPPSTVAREDLRLWVPFLDEVRWFEHAKFYFVRAQGGPDDVTDADLGFKALARLKDGRTRAISGKGTSRWRRLGDEGPEDWVIERFVLEGLHVTDAAEPLFEDVLRAAVPDDATYRVLRRSAHESKIVQLARDGSVRVPKKEYGRSFNPAAVGQHPALAVHDVTGDDLEDLYLMVRWGKNRLLVAQPDGTFIEQGEQYGLDIAGLSAGGVFADFDNDGDADLMLGRSLERSAYYEHDGGRFTDRTAELVEGPLPGLTTSVSAADVDNDGLLDAYLCTYGLARREVHDLAFGTTLLGEAAATELFRRAQEMSNPFLGAPGPPNLLLSNRGDGAFAPSPANDGLDHWLNTFQAVFADYDADGDPDLYLSNDYAPDRVYRNDGVAGMTDVTAAVGGDAMFGFGMGASFGDFDEDGRQDLYVSNMYSKAGRRICDRIEGVDWRIKRLAEGNLLFRNTGSAFDLVSGSAPPKMTVNNAGWSWGGQFADFDNDARLDLYVASGYYTAPRAIANDVDL